MAMSAPSLKFAMMALRMLAVLVTPIALVKVQVPPAVMARRAPNSKPVMTDIQTLVVPATRTARRLELVLAAAIIKFARS